MTLLLGEEDKHTCYWWIASWQRGESYNDDSSGKQYYIFLCHLLGFHLIHLPLVKNIMFHLKLENNPSHIISTSLISDFISFLNYV